MLLRQPVAALAALGLEALHLYPAFFIAPATNPRTVWRCQPIALMISAMVAPLPLHHRDHLGHLAAPARPVDFLAFAPFLPLGAALAGAPSSPPCPSPARPWRPVRHRWPFSVFGFAASRFAASGSARLRPGPGRAPRCGQRPSGVLQRLYRLHTRQAVVRRHQALCRPARDQFGRVPSDGEGVKGVCAAAGPRRWQNAADFVLRCQS